MSHLLTTLSLVLECTHWTNLIHLEQRLLSHPFKCTNLAGILLAIDWIEHTINPTRLKTKAYLLTGKEYLTIATLTDLSNDVELFEPEL